MTHLLAVDRKHELLPLVCPFLGFLKQTNKQTVTQHNTSSIVPTTFNLTKFPKINRVPSKSLASTILLNCN